MKVMAITVDTNDTPQEERDCSQVSTSEVTTNHMMDAIDDSDSDFDDNASDDPNDRYYELLSTQDLMDGSTQATTYYPHNYTVEWVDWDQYEQTLEQQSSDDTNTHTNYTPSDSSGPSTDTPTEASISETTTGPPSDRQISLSDDRIHQIKSLMSGFEIPKDHIPVWAQEVPEDNWKAFLLPKLQDKHN